MAKRDTLKITKRNLDADEMNNDRRPSKETKVAKVKDRQHAKKHIREVHSDAYRIDHEGFVGCDINIGEEHAGKKVVVKVFVEEEE